MYHFTIAMGGKPKEARSISNTICAQFSKTGSQVAGLVQATGEDVRDNPYVLHWTVLPGAGTSYR